jgi:serine/threonine protein kinase
MVRGLEAGASIGPYTVEHQLGAGGYGITYLARDAGLDKQVAIKEFFPKNWAERSKNGDVVPRAATQHKFEEGRQRILKEARALAQLDHHNIVRVITFLEARNTAYIIMDYVRGQSLADAIEARGAFDQASLLAVISPLMDAIEATHKIGIIHLDVKPENILLKGNGTPVLIDFGSVRSASPDEAASDAVTVGYAPIEQHNGGALGAWTDIYSLAAVAYSCVTTSRPHDAPDRSHSDATLPLERQLRARLSRPVIEMIEWGLAVNPSDRPQNVGDWRATLKGKRRPAANRQMQGRAPMSLPAISGNARWVLVAVLVGIVCVGAYFLFPRGTPQIAAGAPQSMGDAPQAAVDASGAESQDFEKASAIDMPEAYAIYLRLHPTGVHSTEALKKSNGSR